MHVYSDHSSICWPVGFEGLALLAELVVETVAVWFGLEVGADTLLGTLLLPDHSFFLAS